MKKLILAIAIIVCSISYAQAQLKVGVKGGVLFSNIHTSKTVASAPDFDLNEFHNTKLGVQAGLFMQAKLSDHIILQPEILWLNQGTQYDEQEKLHFNYVNVPILLGYQPFENFSLLAGPNIAVLASANYEFGDDKIDIKDDLNSKTDFGLNIGIDYQLETGLGFGARYNHSFSSAMTLELTDNGTLVDTIPYKNRSFQLYMTYVFQ